MKHERRNSTSQHNSEMSEASEAEEETPSPKEPDLSEAEKSVQSAKAAKVAATKRKKDEDWAQQALGARRDNMMEAQKEKHAQDEAARASKAVEDEKEAKVARKKAEKEEAWHREMMNVRQRNLEVSRSPQPVESPTRTPLRKQKADELARRPPGSPLSRSELGTMSLKALREHAMSINIPKREVMLSTGKRELIDMVLNNQGVSFQSQSVASAASPAEEALQAKLEADLQRMEGEASSRSRAASRIDDDLAEEDVAIVSDVRDFKGELAAIYVQAGREDMLHDLDRLLIKYAGREQDLVDRMEVRYGVADD